MKTRLAAYANAIKNAWNQSPMKLAVLGSAALISLSACGGGGSGSKGENVIAPESLDGVTIDFFNSFEMRCSRLNGVAGNETGAATYVQLRNSFKLGEKSIGGASLGTQKTISLPVFVKDLEYNYKRVSNNTGKIIFTFSPQDQAYPVGKANKDNTSTSGLEMFWAGENGADVPLGVTTLVVDIQFTEINGLIGMTQSTSAIVRDYYVYSSKWNTVTLTESNSVDVEGAIRTVDVSFYKTNGGALLPAGYTVYRKLFDPAEPVSGIWVDLKAKTIDLNTSNIDFTIIHQSVSEVGPPILGVEKPDDMGNILIDEGAESISGIYTYHRTGGDKAKLRIQYDKNGALQDLLFELDFNSLTSGALTNLNDNSTGTFGLDANKPNVFN